MMRFQHLFSGVRHLFGAHGQYVFGQGRWLLVDEVVSNTAAIEQPALIERAAQVFGNQFVVVSLDVRKHAAGRYEVFTRGDPRFVISPSRQSGYREDRYVLIGRRWVEQNEA